MPATSRPTAVESLQEKPLRSDARINRDAILAAARELMVDHGRHFTIADVAASAGVGRATVYRSFDCVETLVTAVGVKQVEEVRVIAEAVLAHTQSPEFELPFLMFALYDFNQTNRLYLELFGGHPAEELLVAQKRNRQTLDVIVGRAKAIALIYDDVVPEDLYVLIGGSAIQLSSRPTVSGEQWRRLARLVLYGAGVPREIVGRAETAFDTHRIRDRIAL